MDSYNYNSCYTGVHVLVQRELMIWWYVHTGWAVTRVYHWNVCLGRIYGDYKFLHVRARFYRPGEHRTSTNFNEFHVYRGNAKIWVGESLPGLHPRAKFYCEKPIFRPLSKNNTGMAAGNESPLRYKFLAKIRNFDSFWGCNPTFLPR